MSRTKKKYINQFANDTVHEFFMYPAVNTEVCRIATECAIEGGGQAVTPQDFGGSGDGETDNYPAIIEALQNSNNIHFPPGEYLISQSITKDLSGESLTITGDNATIIAGVNMPQGGLNKSILNFSNFDTVYLDGINIDGNKANLLPAIVNWQNFIYGINLSVGNKVIINNTNLVNCPSIATSIDNIQDYVIVSGYSSIDAIYHGLNISLSNNILVDKAYIDGGGTVTTDVLVGGIGILIGRSNKAIVSNSIIKDTPDTGTKMEGTNNSLYQNVQVTNAGKDGIKIQGFSGFRDAVIDGKIIDCTVDGLFTGRSDGSSLITIQALSNGLVQGNTVIGRKASGGTAEDGIRVVRQSATEIANITISDNIIINPLSNGINCVDPKQITIKDNQILYSNNEANSAIALQNSENYSVKDNQCFRSGTATGTGILLLSNKNGEVSNNKVQNFNVAISGQLVATEYVSIEDNETDLTNREAISIAAAGASPIVVGHLSLAGNTINRSCNTINTNGALRVSLSNLNVTYLNLSNITTIDNGVLSPSQSIQFNGSGGTLGEINVSGLNISNCPQPNYVLYTRIVGKPYLTAQPSIGTWKRGDIVMKIDPSANGNLGWVCVTAGTPGTWQPFGYAGDIANGFFAKGGQTAGANMVLGSNDAFALSFRTGGTTRLTIPNNNNNIINAVNNGWGNLYFGDASNSGFFQRDIADAVAAFTIRLQNASSTGHILDLRNNSGIVSFFDNLGRLTTVQLRLSALNTAPATASDTGTLGEIRFTTSGIYICTATNTWIKAAAATF